MASKLQQKPAEANWNGLQSDAALQLEVDVVKFLKGTPCSLSRLNASYGSCDTTASYPAAQQRTSRPHRLTNTDWWGEIFDKEQKSVVISEEKINPLEPKNKPEAWTSKQLTQSARLSWHWDVCIKCYQLLQIHKHTHSQARCTPQHLHLWPPWNLLGLITHHAPLLFGLSLSVMRPLTGCGTTHTLRTHTNVTHKSKQICGAVNVTLSPRHLTELLLSGVSMTPARANQTGHATDEVRGGLVNRPCGPLHHAYRTCETKRVKWGKVLFTFVEKESPQRSFLML